jgi:hypothetical protein
MMGANEDALIARLLREWAQSETSASGARLRHGVDRALLPAPHST